MRAIFPRNFLIRVTILSFIPVAIVSGCGNDDNSEASPVSTTNITQTTTSALDIDLTGNAMLEANAQRNNAFSTNVKQPVGKQKWSLEKNKFEFGYYSDFNNPSTNVVFSADTVYFGKRGVEHDKNTATGLKNGTLFALDPITGIEKWTTNLNFDYLMVTEDIIFGITSNTVYALDTKTGAKKWDYSSPGIGNGQKSGVASVDPQKMPVYGNGVLYFTTGGKLKAYDVESGQIKWEYSHLGANKPVVSNGTIFVLGGRDEGPFGAFGVVAAVDTENGQEKWTWEPENLNTMSAPTISNGMVFIAAKEEYSNRDPNKPDDPKYFFYALDEATGQVKWNIKNDLRGYYECYVSASEDQVFFLMGTGNVRNPLIAVDIKSGKELWRYEGPEKKPTVGEQLAEEAGMGGIGPDISQPAISNGIVYFTTTVRSEQNFNQPAIIGLDGKSGQEKLRYLYPDKGGLLNPIFANGLLYAANSKGSLFAVE